MADNKDFPSSSDVEEEEGEDCYLESDQDDDLDGDRPPRYVDVVMSISKGTLFSMCGMNLAFDRELIDPAMYFGLMGDGQPIGRYDDMLVGRCVKVATIIVVYAHWGFSRIKGCGWGWAGVIWLYSIVFYIPLDILKFMIHYSLSGKAWRSLIQLK
ncbi:uncharacterized protein A4U43_C05F35340 [Asparagus officinalis]|uniref:Uncharacterized protein n=1 Tax=Asparagus officinalis TaxID=4686 RepID=A0A5P1EXL9_ASPOF|nr:uncharacterized protein A4U43_C05F35340 [Asparagus officinalis]